MSGAFSDSRVCADLRMLNLLQMRIRGLSFLPKQPVGSLLSGRHASRVRGRGLNFEEIRAYQPGDDVRTIDWKVTARTRSPHTRVYTEERDRPVLLIVDQRQGMFFGTQLYMKSVICSHLAALTMWQVLEQGDRVGAIVFNDSDRTHVPCRRGKATARQVLTEIVQYNHLLNAVPGGAESSDMLPQVLETACRLAAHDHLVVVISDFNGLNDAARSSLRRLAIKNDLIGMLVHDPSASKIPRADSLVVSDGELQIELGNGSRRQNIEDATSGRLQKVMALRHEVDMSIMPITTADEALPQLLRLLGGGAKW